MQKKSAPSPELQLTFLVKDAMVSGILKRRNDRDADRTMEKFETSILEQLDRECGGEEIVSIGLSRWQFQLYFANSVHISAEEQTVFCLDGKRYVWSEGATNIPVGLLIGQHSARFELPSPFILQACFVSGDSLEFHTVESNWECIQIHFGSKAGVEDVKVF